MSPEAETIILNALAEGLRAIKVPEDVIASVMTQGLPDKTKNRPWCASERGVGGVVETDSDRATPQTEVKNSADN